MSDMTGLDTVLANLGRVEAAMREGAAKAGAAIAVELADYAHANHLWQNQSGDTERTTQAKVAEETREYVLVVLSAGTSYSRFLELAHSGRWAWLWPAVEASKGRILSLLQEHIQAAMSGFGGGAGE